MSSTDTDRPPSRGMRASPEADARDRAIPTSRMYFHAEAETVAVLGAERARVAQLCANITAAVFELLPAERRLALMPQEWVEESARERAPGCEHAVGESFRALLARSFGGRAFSDGERIFDVVLNTALALGSPPLALGARLHGQCERHAYVEQEDVSWLAEMVTEGLAARIFARGAGWEAAIALLRSQPGAVVVSYSSCDAFPNPAAARWTPPTSDGPEGLDDDWRPWYALSPATQWQFALAGLRGRRESPRLDPRDWPGRFGSGRTALHYLSSVACAGSTR